MGVNFFQVVPKCSKQDIYKHFRIVNLADSSDPAYEGIYVCPVCLNKDPEESYVSKDINPVNGFIMALVMFRRIIMILGVILGLVVKTCLLFFDYLVCLSQKTL